MQEDFDKEILEHRSRLIAAEAALAARVDVFVKELTKKWRDELYKVAKGQMSLPLAEIDRRIVTLRVVLREITQTEFDRFAKLVGKEARQTFITEAYRHSHMIEGQVLKTSGSITPVFGGVSRRQLASSFAMDPSKLFGQALQGISRSVLREMQKDIADALADGWKVDRLAKKWQNIKGAARVAKHRSAAAARTAVMEASNNAAIASYEDSGVVEAVMWEATFDARTCMVCGSRHGRTYLIKSAPALPAHISCRCTWLPVFISEREAAALARKKNVGKKVKTRTAGANRASDNEFEVWLRKQSKSVQADFFPSETKMARWRRGVPLADMVSPGGRVLTDDLLPFPRKR